VPVEARYEGVQMFGGKFPKSLVKFAPHAMASPCFKPICKFFLCLSREKIMFVEEIAFLIFF